MIAMNAPLHTSPDARLSAADALSSLSSLTAPREAVARRFVTPLWYKIVSFGCTVVMTMLIWALWGGLFDALTNLQIVLGSASAQVPLVDLAVGGAVYVVLFSIFGQLYDRRRYSDIAKGV